MKWDPGGGMDLDRDREWCPHDFPHQPSKYHITDHFRQRFRQDKRFLTDNRVRRTITLGELADNGDGCARFSYTKHGGVEFTFIGGFLTNGVRVAVTAYPEVLSRKCAFQHGWEVEQLDTIEEEERKAKSHNDERPNRKRRIPNI